MAGLPRSAPLKPPLLVWALAAAVVCTPARGAFQAAAQDTDQAAAEPAFEVASVRLHVPGTTVVRSDPGRFAGTFTIGVLILMAYGLQENGQLVGPDWINTLFLDINAKLSEGATKEQIPRMLQTLLADRLKLTVHQESRVMPVYELRVGKAGPKMKEVEPSRYINQIVRSLPRGFVGHMTMTQLANLLSGSLDRYVLDSTGLKAIYDVDLHWTRDEANAPTAAGVPPQDRPVKTDWPNLFLAIQQQLGLKLEAGRAPVKVVVVGHVERVPTAN